MRNLQIILMHRSRMSHTQKHYSHVAAQKLVNSVSVHFIPFPLSFVPIAIAVVICSFSMSIAKELVSIVLVYDFIRSTQPHFRYEPRRFQCFVDEILNDRQPQLESRDINFTTTIYNMTLYSRLSPSQSKNPLHSVNELPELTNARSKFSGRGGGGWGRRKPGGEEAVPLFFVIFKEKTN